MFPYVIALLACLLIFYNPIAQYLTPSEPARLPRTPRPKINESLLALDAVNQTAEGCPPDAYSVHIISKAPLVVYLENFLSEDEQRHLMEISNPLFEPSTITHDGASTAQDVLVRDSSVALIPRTPEVRCIERRALGFQGWRDDLWLERLRTQRYGPSQHYSHHFDWGSGAYGWARVSSFMVWVATAGEDGEEGGSVVGGGTEFPRLRRREAGGREWCRWVECPEGAAGTAAASGEGAEEGPLGVVFKPVKGNAVYWDNFRPDGTGRGWDETWHAGLPVEKGVKVGLNIWSWGRLD